MKKHKLASLKEKIVKHEGYLNTQVSILEDIEQFQSLNREKLTIAYQLGRALLDAFQSPRCALMLVPELMRVAREAKRRRLLEIKVLSASRNKELSSLVRDRKIIPFPQGVKSIKSLKVACICDEFTYTSFKSEYDLMQLSLPGWEKDIKTFSPDFLFIESAWKGKDDKWETVISNFKEDLQKLFHYARKNNIPIIFWNKEDPVHFESFIEVARHVDYVFTTDIDCIDRYKKRLRHNRVYLLPFAAQTKTHNPIEKYTRKHRACFAGSYYLRYPQRQKDFSEIILAAKEAMPVDIYDRNYGKTHPHYLFPERYQDMIIGSLPFTEIDKAYKGYEYGINMNTIKQSQSMFARRVFELVASNTVVISNFSRGVRNFFGDYVISSDSSSEILRKLKKLTLCKITRDKHKLNALRHVLSAHTYKHRAEFIASKVFSSLPEAKSAKVVVLGAFESKKEASYLVESFQRQKYVSKSLILIGRKSYLNSLDNKDIKVFSSVDKLLEDIQLSGDEYFSYFCTKDYYAPDYLSDLCLATSYVESKVITKDLHYKIISRFKVPLEGKAYSFVDNYSPRRSIIRADTLSHIDLAHMFKDDNIILSASSCFSIDYFNYCEDGALLPDSALEEISTSNQVCVTDLKEINNQIALSDAGRVTTISGEELFSGIGNSIPSSLTVTRCENGFEVYSRLDTKKYAYLYFGARYSLSELSLSADGFFSYEGVASLGELSTLIVFYDKSGEKISHRLTRRINTQHSINAPDGCESVSFGVRITGPGSLTLKSIELSSDKKAGPSTEVYKGSLMSLGASELFSSTNHPASSRVKVSLSGDNIRIISKLEAEKHAYVYFDKKHLRSEVNMLSNSSFIYEGASTLSLVSSVVVFYDDKGNKISHAMNKQIDITHQLAIPENCITVSFGLRVVGPGEVKLKAIHSGVQVELPQQIIGKSSILCLAKQYPSYEDIYKYGFLHTRLKAYKKSGINIDMFRLNPDLSKPFNEFEDIDSVTGSLAMLDKVLSSGRYKHVLVHLLDDKMWSVLEKYIDKIKVTVWVHGAEIQAWQRRSYEFPSLTKEEIKRKKKLSAHRMSFWNKLLSKQHENLHLVFVSKNFKEESEKDIQCEIENYSIIHNPVDTQLFTYVEKKADQRLKILSIRPYASMTYANDLTVRAILLLQNKSYFKHLEFSLYGDGPLFNEVTKPLINLKNVTLHKKFLQQHEIADIHKEHGVLVIPSRMDSQGVSRDEAMASGLVPITTNIAAIPEFVDGETGFLTAPESAEEIAAAVDVLYHDPKRFLAMSEAASIRVRETLDSDIISQREIELFITDK